MSASKSAGLPPSDPLLAEAAEWVIRLRYEPAADADRQAFAHWMARSEAHARAWQRVQEVLKELDRLPGDVGAGTLRRVQRRRGRRAVLGLGAGLAVAAPAAWLAWRTEPWHAWTAELATHAGERRVLTLEDGSRLELNTGTALDLRYGPEERRIVLHKGEILVTTAPEPAHRRFIVQTRAGNVEALGTRFSVRQQDGRIRVAVFEHAVAVHPAAAPTVRLEAGEQAEFDERGVLPAAPVDDSALAWREGRLVARRMRLEDLLAELARYRPGILYCESSVADLPVSGVLSLDDTDAALAMLEDQFGLRVRRISRYWVTVGPG